jgi:hypothetical protein
MKAFVLFLMSVLLTSASCNKRDNRAYSTWYINGQQFSTNNVIYSNVHNSVYSLQGFDTGLLFSIGIEHGDMRFSSDTAGYSKGHHHAGAIFMYGGKRFVPPLDTYFLPRPSVNADPFPLTLDSVWVYYYVASKKQDSLRVSGTFNAP